MQGEHPVGLTSNCTLGEGGTPLLESRLLGAGLGIRLFFKCEYLNPTGSYKDRFTALELSLLREAGSHVVLAASSGNGGASLSAYAARYGVPCCVFVCDNTPPGKLAQIAAYGARVIRVQGYCTDVDATKAIDRELERLAAAQGTRLVLSTYGSSPEGMRGVESIGHEIVAAYPDVDHVFLPAGGGGLFTATARGLLAAANNPPRAHVVQPRLNDTIATPLRQGASAARPVTTVTQISGLANQWVYDGDAAIVAARELDGTGFVVDDEDAYRWRDELLQREGIWVEPAGAVSVAGLEIAVAEGVVSSGDTVVCVLTGHGFKTALGKAAVDVEPALRLELGELERFVSEL